MLKFELVEYYGRNGKKHQVKKWCYLPCDVEEYTHHPQHHHEEWHLLNDTNYNNYIVVSDPRADVHKVSIKPEGSYDEWAPRLERMGIEPTDPVINGVISCFGWMGNYVIKKTNKKVP